MGEVYEAVDEESGDPVAIKVLSPALAATAGFRDRFEAEVESLRMLRHPNIVELYGYGEQQGFLFYSMELVRGHSLEDELNNRRRFNWREVAEIGIKLTKALKHAHDHGVIHRDLKPANILQTHDDEIKLLDFGIARLFGGTHQTNAGGVLGTADYMSPEQADGSLITNRCDQYALGGVMYALATGRPPFSADSLPELLQLQRFAEPEPVRRFAPDFPIDFESTIAKLLEKDPENRFPDMSVLGRHLSAMTKALSRPLADDDFKIATDPIPSAVSHPLDATQVPAERPPATSENSSVGSVTADAASGVVEVDDEAEDQQRNRFTTVAEQERLAREREREPLVVIAARLLSLIAVIVLLAAGVWYAFRPQSADELYATIQSAAEAESRESLLAAEDAIAEFLSRFPRDDRRAEVADLQEEVDLLRAERRLRARAALSGGRGDMVPIERLYVEAIALEDVSPDRALAALSALVDLYGAAESGQSIVQQRTIELARRQIERIERRAAQQRPDVIDDLQRRMARADELAEQQPDKARAMYRAVIELCRNKPWASDLVRQAQTRLAQLESAPPTEE